MHLDHVLNDRVTKAVGVEKELEHKQAPIAVGCFVAKVFHDD